MNTIHTDHNMNDSKRMTIIVPKELFDTFHSSCKIEFKTASEVIRDFMLCYVREHNGKDSQKQTHSTAVRDKG
jgi:metal-responsive CopG/Arc/MetJ family transcriptional regulator